MSIILSSQQNNCKDRIKMWYPSTSAQDFVLAGYAGTGKTTLIDYIIDDLAIPLPKVAFVTFTGKAALVVTLKANGKYRCQTLHSFLYNTEVNKITNQLTFIPKKPSEFTGVDLIVCDECSMVNKELLELLYRTGRKILFVGDHGQLPPVGEASDIYKRLSLNADFTLTDILRQAQGNPIIYLSMLIRTGKKIPLGKMGSNVLIFSKKDLNRYTKSMDRADIVICGYNKTRHQLNKEIRARKGFTNPLPMDGDKLICTANRWQKGVAGYPLVNGMIGYANKVYANAGSHAMDIYFRPEFMQHDTLRSEVLKSNFVTSANPRGLREWDYDPYEFGYAVTCHKAQGSQWDNVFVISEPIGDEPNRWLYTAETRAAVNLMMAV